MAKKEHRQSAFDEANVYDHVKMHLPKQYKLRVYKVTSNDSGKEYWIQFLSSNVDGTRIILCDCPVGKFVQPLEVLALAGDLRCKHVKDLLEVLK
jgi:hypothetical protein